MNSPLKRKRDALDFDTPIVALGESAVEGPYGKTAILKEEEGSVYPFFHTREDGHFTFALVATHGPARGHTEMYLSPEQARRLAAFLDYYADAAEAKEYNMWPYEDPK